MSVHTVTQKEKEPLGMAVPNRLIGNLITYQVYQIRGGLAMEYVVDKYFDGEWYYEGRGNIDYVNKMIKFYTLERGILIQVTEVKK